MLGEDAVNGIAVANVHRLEPVALARQNGRKRL